MFAQVVNKLKVTKKIPLKQAITENFTHQNGKFFYSIEVTPKKELKIDFNEFKILPLFVNITWIKNENLIRPLRNALAFELAREIKTVHVVNNISCYKFTNDHVEILKNEEIVENIMIVRGGTYIDIGKILVIA